MDYNNNSSRSLNLSINGHQSRGTSLAPINIVLHVSYIGRFSFVDSLSPEWPAVMYLCNYLWQFLELTKFWSYKISFEIE